VVVKRLKGDEYHQAVGFYAVFARSGVGKYVAKVLSVDMDARVMRYEVASGPYKGNIMNGRFVNGKTIRIYDEGALVKAILNTRENG
jgi:hypothetical protein